MATPTELAKSFLAGIGACPELVFADAPALRQMVRSGIGAQDEAEQIFAELKAALERYRAATGIGRGLAAPQIGLRSRAFVTCLGDEWQLFLNPSILERSEARSLYRESCLSCGPISCDVARPSEITATWTTVNGKIVTDRLSGFEARIFQHELDHLDGILCVDIAEPGSVNLRLEDPLAEKLRPIL